MKRLIIATSVAFAAVTASSQAADMDHDLGLKISGVVDQWMGVQYIEDGGTDDTVFATGGEGLLSLPLGDNLSIQSDVKYETNDRAFKRFELPIGPRYSYQGAVHLSWRDPMSGLFGTFGGMGTSNQQQALGTDADFRFVGGEGQIYLDNMTLYAQGGYVDFVENDSFIGPPIPLPFGIGSLDDGFFARGVVRWFLDSSSRLQFEGTYLNADFANGGGDTEAFSVDARYDFIIPSMPLIGDAPIYVAYRGTFRDSCGDLPAPDNDFNFGDLSDHTVMVGTSYSFSGDYLTVDRQGATLDTPDFNYNCHANRLITSPSDRRLKTDIAELGETENGIRLYSWKYKSDAVTTWVGVMAQDLETTHPGALVIGTDGFYRVNYSKLGVRMMTLEQWNARNL